MEKILRGLYMVADAVGFSSLFVAEFTFATLTSTRFVEHNP
jgi:hypothetical protein